MQYDPMALGAASLVASALGRVLGVKVVIRSDAKTAYTDKDSIVLPVLPVNLDAQLSKVLWGFIHHEAGHCRHTDFDILKEPDLRSDRMLNGLFRALEDIRMELAHIAFYPGAARILHDLVQTLVDIGFFKPLPADVDESAAFHAFVLKYLRQTALGQQALADQVLGAREFLEGSMGPGFVTRLVAELQPIHDAASTIDALNLAYRIRQFIEDELEEQQQSQQSDDGNGSSSNEQTSTSSNHPSSNTGSDSADADSNAPDDAASDAPDSSGSDESTGSGDDSASGGDEQDNASQSLQKILDGSDLDASLGDLGDALSDVLSEGIENSGANPIALPADHRRNDGYRDASSVTQARSVTSRLAVQLKRQLESVNDVVSDPSYRGKRISRRHLSRVAHKDYRVFAHREQQPEVNTAVVSLIDASGSMSGTEIKIASSAILATALALGTIPFLAHAVGAFPSRKGSDYVEIIQDFGENAEQVSSRFNTDARGSTPLAQALLWAADRLLRRSEERRIVFVATDGQPDDVVSTKQLLTHLRRLNIEVHGLGICTDDDHKLFDSFSVVKDIQCLPQAFLTLFQRVLRRSA